VPARVVTRPRGQRDAAQHLVGSVRLLQKTMGRGAGVETCRTDILPVPPTSPPSHAVERTTIARVPAASMARPSGVVEGRRRAQPVREGGPGDAACEVVLTCPKGRVTSRIRLLPESD